MLSVVLQRAKRIKINSADTEPTPSAQKSSEKKTNNKKKNIV